MSWRYVDVFPSLWTIMSRLVRRIRNADDITKLFHQQKVLGQKYGCANWSARK